MERKGPCFMIVGLWSVLSQMDLSSLESDDVLMRL